MFTKLFTKLFGRDRSATICPEVEYLKLQILAEVKR